ncbi:putative enhancer of mRNA-decapping protein 3 [Ditylenchus destructor]|uniref:Enhancer of mRNA-decapping protein 3 n=1 Tax=Ditylenchus destructor TaxID=166010 RepID=A0AAD4MXB7_9BILA|nr:putative enhancer of mRNA-decapping protein 3 [Ditylenchus destructor]
MKSLQKGGCAMEHPAKPVLGNRNASFEATKEFRGCSILIQDKDGGFYEGIVLSVDAIEKLITIEKPIRDGMPLSDQNLTLPASQVYDLKIMRCRTLAKCEPPKCRDKVHIDPIQSDPLRAVLPRKDKNNGNMKPNSQARLNLQENRGGMQESKRKKKTSNKSSPNVRRPSPSSANAPSGNPMLDSVNGYSSQFSSAKAAGFAQPIDFKQMDVDFDFESNLALFDKNELSSSSSTSGSQDNFRHDENVLNDPSKIISWTLGNSKNSVPEFWKDFCGCHISIAAKDNSCYQGIILSVDTFNKSVTISFPYKDGVPLNDQNLTLFASSIRDLKIMRMANATAPSNENSSRMGDEKRELQTIQKADPEQVKSNNVKSTSTQTSDYDIQGKQTTFQASPINANVNKNLTSHGQFKCSVVPKQTTEKCNKCIGTSDCDETPFFREYSETSEMSFRFHGIASSSL